MYFNMKKIYKNLVNGSFLGVALLLGATACSDDHFDVKDPSGIVGGNTTIWESIVANDSIFSEAKSILERTHVMADDKDKKATLTYAEWLNQPMEVTVWLPKNGSFDEKLEYFNSLLDRADSLRSKDSLAQALKVEYQVVSQFVRNHMALFNNAGSNSFQKVRLLNSKLCNFDVPNATFNGIAIDEALTTHNSNGVLYALKDGASPYAYNIFDYMSSKDDFSTIYNVISDPAIDKNVFWPEGSTEGAMNENGEIVYVDSVYRNSNELLSRANALIKSEDSLYVAFMPTNEAWAPTMEVVKDMFVYGKSYDYEWDDDRFINKGAVNGLTFNVDSLQEASARSQIIESMFFNVSEFHLGENPTDEAIVEYVKYADSLISTNGVVYYNKAKVLAGFDSDKKVLNPMFEGLDYIKASNGLIFAPSECRIIPEYSFIRRTETRPSSMIAKVDGTHTITSLTIDNWQKDLVAGSVQDDWYSYFKKGNKDLKIKLRLSNLASGHYKVSAQMLPNRININNVSYEDDGITPKVETPLFNVSVKTDDMKAFPGKSSQNNVSVDQDSVKNVVLIEDLNVSKSYRKLPSNYETFAILEIIMKNSQARKGNCEALSIGKIVIEPIRK